MGRFKLLVLVLMLSLSGSAVVTPACGDEPVAEVPSEEEVARFINDYLHGNTVEQRKSARELANLRTHRNLTLLIESIKKSRNPYSEYTKFFDLIARIGEPAVEPAFDLAAGGALIPKKLLIYELKGAAIPLLVDKARHGMDNERETAAYLMRMMLRRENLGDNDPHVVAFGLYQAIVRESRANVRVDLFAGLNGLKHEACVGPLVEMLAHEHLRASACESLRRLAEKAVDAGGPLRKGIANRSLPPHAYSALACVEGIEATPFLVEVLEGEDLSQKERNSITRSLAHHPHVAALKHMEQELAAGREETRVSVAEYFAGLDHPRSVPALRQCLRSRSDRHNWETNRIRGLSAVSLAERGDMESYPAIAALLTDKPSDDPADVVRGQASEAVGIARYEPAVPALVRNLSRFDVTEHRRKQTVGALAAIGNEEALRGLYDGCSGQSSRECLAFWSRADDPALLTKLLAFIGEDAIKPQTAFALDQLLKRHGQSYEIPAPDRAVADANFHRRVEDGEYFASDDLTGKGTYKVTTTLTIYKPGFARVSVTQLAAEGAYYQRQTDLLYQQQGKVWKRVAIIGRSIAQE